MRYAIVESGKVVNVVECDEGTDLGLSDRQSAIASDTASPGDPWALDESKADPAALDYIDVLEERVADLEARLAKLEGR